MAYISLEHVVKRYKMGEVTITAVDDITFDIEKGEFVIIVGPSGAGKTDGAEYFGRHGRLRRGHRFWWTARRSANATPAS